jgi:YfiH family protein
VWLEIRTADCAPVILADPHNRALAVIHAGWRGVAAEIVPRTAGILAETYGSTPDGLLAAIGPVIGECCYEVGPEVSCQFYRWWPERPDLVGSAHVRISLADTIVRQLTQAGVPLTAIDTTAACTCCHSAHLHSFRRERQNAGRQRSGARLI